MQVQYVYHCCLCLIFDQISVQLQPQLFSFNKNICSTKNNFIQQQSSRTFKIDQSKKSKPFNRLSLKSGNRKKVDMQGLSPRFRSQQFFLMGDMRRNVFPKFIEICKETPCWCPPRWAPTWRPETSRNICH